MEENPQISDHGQQLQLRHLQFVMVPVMDSGPAVRLFWMLQVYQIEKYGEQAPAKYMYGVFVILMVSGITVMLHSGRDADITSHT